MNIVKTVAESKLLCHKYHYKSPFGVLYIEDNGFAVTTIRQCQSGYDNKNDSKSDLIDITIGQLDEYFMGKRKIFDIPIAPKGTEFQQKVWKVLTDIPYGETRTYGEIAHKVGNPKACRAVGGANNKNPIMIIIPCHRVIGRNGDLTGYAGGLSVKQYLLELEKDNKK